jgi:outer membrane receptor protein involved in Fe transport
MIAQIRLNTFLTYLTIAGLIVFGNIASYGQGKNEEVTIIAPYIPSIGDATKIPFRPEINPAEQDTPAFEYEYVTRKIETRMELDPVEPMKYSEGEQEQLYRNYAKLGYGNYVTPYLDFMASSLQSEKYQFGARIKHHSSQGKIKNYPPSAFSHNLISIFGRTFTKNHTFSADIGYKRDVVHFYGFQPDSFPEVDYTKDDLKQRFQHIHGTVEFGSNFKRDYLLNHFFRLSLHHYNDFYDTRESQISFLTKLDKAFKTSGKDFEHEFALDLGLDYLNYRDTVSSSNPLFFMMRPLYRLEFGQYRFEAGLSINITGENSPLQATNALSVFPILKAEVVILENQLKAFAEVSGNRTINSYRSITGINPFINSTPTIFFTDEKIRIGGGITGNAAGLNFLAEASYSYLMDMPLYITDTKLALQNKFDVIYDDINLLKIKASLGYVKMNQLSVRLLAAYYHYIPQDEDKAWQMPNYEVGFDAGYTFLEKYTLRASALALGSKYAKTFTDGQLTAVKMSGALDLGAGFEYQVSRMLSAYIDVNNILNQNYQRWYHYPVQGILVMAGVRLSF